MTTITSISLADFCDEQTTVEILAHTDENEETFYIQTVDAEYRGDLGCWITTSDSDGEIDRDHYPDFDIELIIKAAEKFMRGNSELTHIKDDYYYRVINDSKCEIVEENKNFINSETSSYQPKYWVVGKFGSIEEARSNFANAVEHYTKTGETFNA